MFITKQNLRRILREIGLEIWANGLIGSDFTSHLISRVANLERLEKLDHDDILTLTHKFNKLLEYLKLEYQQTCREDLPKIKKAGVPPLQVATGKEVENASSSNASHK